MATPLTIHGRHPTQRCQRQARRWVTGLVLLSLATATHALPSVQIGRPALIDPVTAEATYPATTTSTPSIFTATPNEIVELSRALGNNVDQIYDFVLNNVDTVFAYGTQKGAVGAMIDKAGTPFDQVQLMIALLRQAGYTASYKVGTITLTGSQFSAWTNIANARAACDLLASGGIPASINGSSASMLCTTLSASTTLTTVTLAHVWVDAVISGSHYVFDPSFKTYTFKSAINLSTAAGLVSGAPMSAATGTGYSTGTLTSGGVNVNFVKNLNAESLTTLLTTYATNLQSTIQNGSSVNIPSVPLASAEIKDLVGGREILRYAPSAPVRQTTLPYPSANTRTWAGNVPDAYRSSLTVSLTKVRPGGSIDQILPASTLFSDDIYGRKLVYNTTFLKSSFTGTLQAVDEFGNATVIRTYTNGDNPALSLGTLTLAVRHPYLADAAGTTAPLGTYMDTIVTRDLHYATPFLILHGWGETNRGLTEKWSTRPDTELPTQVPPGCETCAPTYAAAAGDGRREQLAASWLVQASKAARLHASIANSVFTLHHSIGIVSGETEIAATDLNPPGAPQNFLYSVAENFDRLDIDSAFSVTSTASNSSDRNAAIYAITTTFEALEGSVPGQSQDLPDVVSVAARLQWGNRPPAADDPSGAGARRILDFSAANASVAQGLLLVNGVYTTTASDMHSGATPSIGSVETSARQAAVASLIGSYASSGFRVFAMEEAFLGPGQMAGSFIRNGTTPLYSHRYSKQRGGAFVATLLDTNGDPVSIAHIAANVGASGGALGIKGGGGGTQPTHQSQYDPSTAADVLKSRFVDRSSAEGVDLKNGAVSFQSPAALTVGSGQFPYSLTANLVWMGGTVRNDEFGPLPHVEPVAPWTTNWNNTLTVSGSALEILGEGDIRATAGTVAAFIAMQDIYRSALSAQRDTAAALVTAWWTQQASGNIVTANIGTGSRQFVRKFDNTWLAPGAGGYATLTQTGQRTIVTRAPVACGAPVPVTYALTRGWDASAVSFVVTNAQGDQQSFGNFHYTYRDINNNYCAYQQGFRLNSWSFPYGVTVSLSYSTPTTGAQPQLLSVSNSLGRQINFVNSGLGGFNNNLSGSDARAVTVTQSTDGTTTSHTDPAGAVTTVSQSVAGNRNLLDQVYTADSATVPSFNYVYDTLYRPQTVQDAVALKSGGRNPYTFYFGEKVRASRVDPVGGQYGVLFDLYHRPMQYSDELGRVTSLSHDGRGRTTGYVYPELDQEVLAYDDRNNELSITRQPKPGSGLTATVISATWDPNWNKPLSITDALGNETDLTYVASGNGAGEMATALRPAPTTGGTRPLYQFAYNAFGQVLTATDPTGLVSTNTYDAVNGNKLTSTLDPTGINAITNFAYDLRGDVVTVTDPRGNAVEQQYDADRRKTVTLHHSGALSTAVVAAEKTVYDLLGRETETDGGTAFSGSTVTTWQVRGQKTYTPTSKVLTSLDGAGDTTLYGYDGMDRTVLVTDPVGRRAATVYDLAGQATCQFKGWQSATVLPGATDCTNWSAAGYAGTGTVRYVRTTYSQNGHPLTALDANGNLSTTVYDGFDRVIQQQYPLPTLGSAASNPADYEAFTYDANGNRLSERRRDGQVIAFSYDNLNRMSVKQLPGASTGWVYYGYDLASRPTSAHFGSTTGSGVDYGYDSAKRVVSESTVGHTLQYQYDLSGNRTRLTFPDGHYLQHDFDGLNRETQIREDGATSGVGVLVTYGYDAFSRKVSVTRGNGTSAGFGYDLASRLTSLNQNNTGTAQDVTFGFGYTLASQLQSRMSSNTLYDWLPAAASQSYSRDGLDRYTAVGGSTYGYDGRGNLTSDGTRTLSYDVENHLLSVSGGSAPITLSYDPLGRLTQSVSGTSTTQFVYDGDRLTAEYDGSNNLLRRYVHGPGTDNPEVWYEGSTLATRNWLESDERGTVIATSDSTGAATVYTYGPYGEPTTWSGSRFRYTGQIALFEAKLYHYKARVYDPAIGRFLQTDPIGSKDDFNLYAYVGNDPVDRTDPSGNCPSCIGALIGVAVDYGIQVTANLVSGESVGDALTHISGKSLLVSAALGAVGNMGGGKALTTLARGLSNQTKGRIGEAVARVGIAARGEKFISKGEKAGELAELGKLSGRAQNAKPDFFVQRADGSTGFVEAKFGNSQLTPAQAELRNQVGNDAFRVSRTSYDDVRSAGGAVGSAASGAAGNCVSGAPGPCQK